MARIFKFLFWNIHHNDNNIQRATVYAQKHGIDVVAFCEANSRSFADDYTQGYKVLQHVDVSKGIEVLVKPDVQAFYAREKERYCIIHIGDRHSINAVIAHLNSDLHSSGRTYRDKDILSIKSDLEKEEIKYGNKNSIVIGDLNINLFDHQITSWPGFNASFFRYAAEKGHRTIRDEKQDIFYNPMLHVYKDDESEFIAKGTWHNRGTNEWYCFDQVLLKQPLISRFDVSKLKILSDFDGEVLVKHHKPIESISDHMPIYFEINEREG